MPTKTRWSSGPGAGETWRSSPVWRALRDMRIEPEGAAFTFTQRLARENGWSPAYAAAVFEEYKRFLFLAGPSGEPMTPSGDVDQAWHLHLLYSRHYWHVLCEEILGRPLHHGPTAGGEAEALRHDKQYEITLRRYRDAFGSDAPAAIWPPAGIRFASKHLWVDSGRYWLVPKALSGRSLLALGATSTAACSAAAAGAPDSTLVFAAVAILVIVAMLVAAARRSAGTDRKRRDDGGCGGGGGGCRSDRSDDGGGSGCGGCGGD